MMLVFVNLLDNYLSIIHFIPFLISAKKLGVYGDRS